jgi:hypothetical protein
MYTLPSSRDQNISQYIFGASEKKKFEVCRYVNEGTTTHFFFVWWVTKYSSFNESPYLL